MNASRVCPRCGVEYPGDQRFCPSDGVTLVPADSGQELPGRTVAGRYHVLRRIGAGGMGEVYLAEHVRMGRRCALKVIRKSLLEDREALARFNREAANASRISHPNVAAIYDFGEDDDGLVFLAMEFVDGRSLHDVVEDEGPLSMERAGRIVSQVASALDDAHAQAIVHRDLKPDNILLARARDGSDIVKVVDFGIARMMEGDQQKVTRSGFVVGTPDYMSPEQLSGDPADPATDQYALALLSFRVLTGSLPFSGATSHESMIRRLSEPPATLAEVRGDIPWPPTLQLVFDRALARLPRERFPNVTAFATAFNHALSGTDPATLKRKFGTPGYSRAVEPMTGLLRAGDELAAASERPPGVSGAGSRPHINGSRTDPEPAARTRPVESAPQRDTTPGPQGAPPAAARHPRSGLLTGILVGGSVAIAAAAVAMLFSRSGETTATAPVGKSDSAPIAAGRTDTVFIERAGPAALRNTPEPAPPAAAESTVGSRASATAEGGAAAGSNVDVLDSTRPVERRPPARGPGDRPGGRESALAESDSSSAGSIEEELARIEGLVVRSVQGAVVSSAELRAARRRVDLASRRVPSRIVRQRAFFDGVMLDVLLAPGPRSCATLDQALSRMPDPRLLGLGRDVQRDKCTRRAR